jgi:hypothetical protein
MRFWREAVQVLVVCAAKAGRMFVSYHPPTQKTVGVPTCTRMIAELWPATAIAIIEVVDGYAITHAVPMCGSAIRSLCKHKHQHARSDTFLPNNPPNSAEPHGLCFN